MDQLDPIWLDVLILFMLTLIAIFLVRIDSVVTKGVNQIVTALQAIYEEHRKDA